MSSKKIRRKGPAPRMKHLCEDVFSGPTAITVAGKRVQIDAPDSWAHIHMGRAFKSGNPNDVVRAFSKLVRTYVKFDLEGTGEYVVLPEDVYMGKVLLAEELDILWLMRWANSSSEIPWGNDCPCPTRHPLAAIIPGKAFRRQLYECSDAECVCHEINAEMFEVWAELADKKEWDNIEWMNERWHELPHDHITTDSEIKVSFADVDPADFPNFNLRVISDLVVFARVPTAAQRPTMLGENAALSDLSAGEVPKATMLAAFVTGFQWPSKGIVEREERKVAIEQFLSGAKDQMLVHIEHTVMRGAGGIENVASVQCTHCDRNLRVVVPFDRDFILPGGS